MSVFAVIPIGGKGTRMHADKPKQFIEVEGKCIAMHTIEKFQKNPFIDYIVLACLDEYHDYIINECERNFITKLIGVVPGGATQLLSINNCLDFISNKAKTHDKIIIHVGNRPLISQKLITKCLKKYDEVGMLSTCLPCVEAMVSKKKNEIVSRNDVVRLQTPQVYSYGDIMSVKNIISGVNDYSTVCDLMIDNGKDVALIEGEFSNFKITYPNDLKMFELIIRGE